MTTLNEMKAQLAELEKIKADFVLAGSGVTALTGEFIREREKMDDLAREIDIRTRAADEVIGRVAPLAQMWLVSALDQAGSGIVLHDAEA